LVSGSAYLTVQVASSPPALLHPALEGGAPAFDVAGPANGSVVILFSPDLVTWMPLLTNASPSGTWHFLDSFTPPHPARFYRARLQP
jgi:hypothetical protein